MVTVEAADAPAERIVATAEKLLADRIHDLVVRIEMPAGDPRLEWVREHFGSDPRVRVGPAMSALDEFPFAAFHVAVPAGPTFASGLVHRLRSELGPSAAARTILDDGSTVSMARSWALHRARRTGRPPDDFGDVIAVPARTLRIASDRPPVMAGAVLGRRVRDLYPKVRQVLTRMRRIRAPRHAWWFLRWLGRTALGWAAPFLRPTLRHPASAGVRPGTADGSRLSLGAEIVVLGARAMFRATRRVAGQVAEGHVDVVVADTPAEATAADLPVVVLSQSPAHLSVPAVDPLVDNPIGWVRAVSPVAAALGPLEHLPPGVEAQRIIHRRDRVGLRWIHHLEDVQAFHAGVVERAGELARRLTACGVVIHLADRDARLRPYLGAELHDLMLTDVRDADLAARQLLSIRMRRAALREHSLRSRARQICEAAGLPDPPRLPLVSIVLVTRRPELLPGALAMIVRQRYPRLELVLGLHGEGFGDAERLVAGLPVPSTIVRSAARLPLGSVLNAAAAASNGRLLAKMDDDDVYGAEHIWDLVLAHEYSGAQFVAKGTEFVYLAGSDRTVHRFREGGERYVDPGRGVLAGGALLIARHDLDRAGGWRRVPYSEDLALIEDIFRAGGRVYGTHGSGFVLVRHGRRPTWEIDDDDAYFLERAEEVRPGWDPVLAGLADVPSPRMPSEPHASDRGATGRSARFPLADPRVPASRDR